MQCSDQITWLVNKLTGGRGGGGGGGTNPRPVLGAWHWTEALFEAEGCSGRTLGERASLVTLDTSLMVCMLLSERIESETRQVWLWFICLFLVSISVFLISF